MEYEEWIKRERNIRLSILRSRLFSDGICRICLACDEICLCHETKCPNCNSCDIQEKFIDPKITISHNIRCRYRFSNLDTKD